MKQSERTNHMDIISTEFNQSCQYPVCFTRNVFNTSNTTLLEAVSGKHGTRILPAAVFIDEGLVSQTPGLLKDISKWFDSHKNRVNLSCDPVVFPGGEGVKNSWDHVHRATRIMNDAALDRHGVVIAVGGGALLDMAGFAAAIFHRGIQLIRMPTTTLAQNDAGIGVKNGINQFGRKNCIGTFCLPVAVINDLDFLKTLPFDHFIGGVAEAFKIALIRDTSFFSFLEKMCLLLKQRDPYAIEETIKRCARLHLEHIAQSGDAFETGSSRPLDYGHWSAHKIEAMSSFSMGHGQAVSIGIALDSYYAWKQSLIARTELDRIIIALTRCGLPVWSKYLDIEDSKGHLEIENGLEEFRQHLGGRLTFTMPDGIGQTCEYHEMDFDIIREGIDFLKQKQMAPDRNEPAEKAVNQA